MAGLLRSCQPKSGWGPPSKVFIQLSSTYLSQRNAVWIVENLKQRQEEASLQLQTSQICYSEDEGCEQVVLPWWAQEEEWDPVAEPARLGLQSQPAAN